ncbi:MAG: tetratricopeptide repeat protein [Candidatus Loosdrechtia sp.]|uniref:tetratricopeptide repeat protein n=1 Tax=Candidatus Loosdrechtia sp. TaxID=3101272 RepID=UPI003A70D231|nr:MAG: tetratricopeptide repeat protein [Candidatus Jettenia sp. AMX2]
MICKHIACVSILIVSLFTVFLSGCLEAAERDGEGTELLNILIDKYEKRMVDERTVLEGLKKLFELKHSKNLADEDISDKIADINERITVEQSAGKYGAVLYSVKADLVTVGDALQTLTSVSGKDSIIDADIDKEVLSSVISLHLENLPLIDILDIILGKKGLEAIIMNENLLYVTSPAKLNVPSLHIYYQEKAMLAYQRAMVKYPDYKEIARAYYEVGNFYLTSGYPSIALEKYKIITESYPDHPLAKESLLLEGKCYEMLDDRENAKLSYLNYVQRYPRSSDVDEIYLIIGDLWEKLGNYEKAIDIYRYIIEEFPDRDLSIMAHMRLGFAYMDLQDFATALQTFQTIKMKSQREGECQNDGEVQMPGRFILSDALRYELNYQIGNCYFLLGKYDDAINMLGKIVLYYKNSNVTDKAYYRLADCFFEMGDFLTAFQLYKNALSEYPGSSLIPHGFLYSGKSLRQIKMFDTAVEILNQGIRNHSEGAYAEGMKFEIGLCYFDDGNYKMALYMFEEIAKRKKDKNLAVQAYIYAGICLERESKPDEAIKYYRKALAEEGITEDQRNRVFGLIGDSYSNRGLPAKAIKAYQHGI